MHVNGHGAACAAIGIDQILLSDVAVRLADRAKWQIHNDVCAESPLARSDTLVSESIPRKKIDISLAQRMRICSLPQSSRWQVCSAAR